MSDAVKAELMEYAQSQAGTRLGRTLGALMRSDRDRLAFWPGSLVVPSATVERMDDPGNGEAVVIDAAHRFAHMRACIGFVVTEEDTQPTASAWLTVNGAIIDPMRRRRTLLGALGVELRETERANWTPTQPGAVAERAVHGHRLTV